MADYREISQEYAQGAIKACILINAGAAAALLTQSAKFIEMNKPGLTTGLMCAMLIWAVGTVVAISTWIFAFLSTRYVDKSEKEPAFSDRYLRKSNAWMRAGVLSIIASLLMFLAGCIALARGL